MRHVDKGATPAILSGDGVVFQNAAIQFALHDTAPPGLLSNLRKHGTVSVVHGQRSVSYSSALFTKYSYYSNPAVKRQLITEHAGKCVYCESFIMTTDVGDVEHFRPKAEVTVRDPDDPDHQVSVDDHPGYFWLSADWGNLFLSCKQCNQAYKRNFFDVFPNTPRSTPATPGTVETPLLLSPGFSDQDLRTLIRYNPDTAEVLRNPIDLFGEIANPNFWLPVIGRTIEIPGLNRPRLLEARANHLVKIRALFVLVANHGALPANHLQPQLSDARPAILDFMTFAGSAAADALVALHRAVEPSAEYSALVIDALLVWSSALEFQAVPAEVSLEQHNQLFLQIAPQRLNAQIELAEHHRLANAASSEAEADPDTTELDTQYNELLGRYKKQMKALGAEAQALHDRRMRVNTLSEQYQLAREQSNLAQIEGDHAELVGERTQLLRAVGGDPSRAAQPRFDQVQYGIAQREAWFQGPGQQIVADDNARLQTIEAMEAPLAARWNLLQQINEDVIEVTEAYRRIGANRQARLVRCEAFEAALESATNWLDSGTEPSAEVLNHLQNRGYPPAIRK